MAVISNLAPEFKTNDIYIKIAVGNPILHYTWEDGQFTSYAINIETNSPAFSVSKSTVRRRYSEFVQLRKMLKSQEPAIQPPPLPSRSFFRNRFKPDFIEERSQGLEKFLHKVFEIPLYLSNKTVHLFSQSKLSMNEVSAIVTGNKINVSNITSVQKLKRLEDITDSNSAINNSRIKHHTPTLHVLNASDDEHDDLPVICSYTPPLRNSSSPNQITQSLPEISKCSCEKSDEITVASLCEIHVYNNELRIE